MPEIEYSKAVDMLMERRKNAKSSIEAVRKCLAKLGDPHLKYPCIHVAGTNGKGSVCAFFEAVLSAAGYRTGLYISPHLTDIKERISISGSVVSKNDFALLLKKVMKAEDAPLNYFETLTCMMFLYFAEQGTDIAVVEAGIGGRLDSTNVIVSPAVSVITSVDLDHTALLGSTVEEIAREKAGIMKSGSPCVCGKLEGRIKDIAAETAKNTGSQIIFSGNSWKPVEFLWEKGTMTVSGPDGKIREIGLMGRYQADNAAIIYAALPFLRNKGFDVSENALTDGLRDVRWFARFQIISDFMGRNFIIDGCHNPAAAQEFAVMFKASPWFEKDTAFVIGMLRDKDHAGVVKALAGCMKRVIVTAPEGERAMSPDDLAGEIRAICPACEIEVRQKFDDALAAAVSSEHVAVVGSFYLAGSVLRRMTTAQVDRL